MLICWGDFIGERESSQYEHCHPVWGETELTFSVASCAVSLNLRIRNRTCPLFSLLYQELVWYLLNLKFKLEPHTQAGPACLKKHPSLFLQEQFSFQT